MKKIVLFILSSILFMGLLTACSNQKQSNNIPIEEPSKITLKEQDVREVVWNQLNLEDKERIKGTWQDSKVIKGTLKGNIKIVNNKSYFGKKVYLIKFPLKDSPYPKSVSVYASLEEYKIIGYQLLD